MLSKIHIPVGNHNAKDLLAQIDDLCKKLDIKAKCWQIGRDHLIIEIEHSTMNQIFDLGRLFERIN